jgi:DNA repair exonuclease SbcCD ATPase subunit
MSTVPYLLRGERPKKILHRIERRLATAKENGPEAKYESDEYEDDIAEFMELMFPFSVLSGLRIFGAAALEQLDKQLHTNTTEATTLLKAARTEIKRLRDLKTLEGEEAEKFTRQQGELGGKEKTLVADQATRRGRIKADDDNRRRKAEQEKATSDARALLAVWQRLRDLIGAADGSKFRKYAQSITLDILLRHANRHLSKLSDRYRIGRCESTSGQGKSASSDRIRIMAPKPRSPNEATSSAMVSLGSGAWPRSSRTSENRRRSSFGGGWAGIRRGARLEIAPI